MTTPAPELKRLGSVAEYASTAAAVAGRLYETSKTYVPERLQPAVAAAESRALGLASPYVAALSDKGATALQAVDSKVDAAIVSAHQAYTANSAHLAAVVAQQRAARAADLEQLAAARQAYLKRVEESVAFVRAAGLEGTAKAAADVLQLKVEEARRVPEALLGEISEAWAKFVHMPAVERLLAASRLQVEAAFTKYMAAHDALVADPRYSAAVTKGSELLASLQSTTAYRAAACRLTPLLAPYAETATKVAAPYVAALSAHLAPVPAQ